MRLFIVRHTKAAEGDPDELRPLTPEGREKAREVGKQLASDGVRPDAVLTSPLLRARETAEEIARSVGAEAEPDERLAPGATTDDVLAAVAGRGETVLIVGHQPDCGRVAAELGDGVEPPFPAGGVAVVQLD